MPLPAHTEASYASRSWLPRDTVVEQDAVLTKIKFYPDQF